jgi:hypothetical protein
MLKVVMFASLLVLSPLFGQVALAHVCCYTIYNTVLSRKTVGCTIVTENLRTWQEYRPTSSAANHGHSYKTGNYIIFTNSKIPNCPPGIPSIQEGN